MTVKKTRPTPAKPRPPLQVAVVFLLGGVLALLGMMERTASPTRASPLTGDGAVIEVNCPDPRGCFLKVGEAIEAAPEGATIKIGPGIYYEKPIHIEKSLVLQGEGASEIQIRTIEPGAAFTVQSPNPLSFTLQGLSLRTRTLERETTHSNAGILWQQERNASAQQDILIQEVVIESSSGVSVAAWKGQLRLKQSRIYGLFGAGLGVTGGGDLEVEAEGNIFIGLSWSSSTFPFSTWAIALKGELGGGRIRVSLKQNEILGWDLGGLGVVSAGHVGWAGVDVLLEKNKITSNGGQGVYLAGDAVAELVGNEIITNDYGVMLSLPPCLSSPPEIAFQGTIRGADNNIQGNKKGDLCPSGYPWPPDFIKNP